VEIGHRLFPGKIVRILEPRVTLESTSSEIKVLQEKVLYWIQKYLTMKRGSLYIGCKSSSFISSFFWFLFLSSFGLSVFLVFSPFSSPFFYTGDGSRGNCRVPVGCRSVFSLQGVCSVSRGRRWWMEMTNDAVSGLEWLFLNLVFEVLTFVEQTPGKMSIRTLHFGAFYKAVFGF